MYLHIGAGVLLREKDVIGIFDLDGKVTTADTAFFLRKAEREGKASLAGDDLPKCFVLTAGKNEENVVFSPISAKVLAARPDPFAPEKNTKRTKVR